MAESIVTLRVEAKNAISQLNRTSQATKNLSNSAKGATGTLTTASAAAKGLGASLAASLGPLLTLGAAVATVSNAIRTFSDRERDVTILAQGLKNLGEGTATLNELQKAADRLGNQTLFDQEEFTRGFNLLTSFRKIGVDSYSRVAQAAADIAQVNQVDVTTSFMQLAKALQDPERNLSNLNRSGIAFTKTQTDVIKELMKTNKTAEAHSMILEIVEESYNKLSQAAAEGFAGEVDSLGEAFRDFSETLGKVLEPILILTTKALTALIKAANDLFNSPLGKTAGLFSAIAFAAQGVVIALPIISAGLIKVAAAGGVATIALNAIPFVAIATAAGLLTTAIFDATKKQRDYNKALKEGNKQALKKEFNKLFIERQKLLARIAKAEANSNKRAEVSLRKQLNANEELSETILDRLNTKNEIITKDQQINQNLIKQSSISNDIKNKTRGTNNEINLSNLLTRRTNNILNETNLLTKKTNNNLNETNELTEGTNKNFNETNKFIAETKKLIAGTNNNLDETNELTARTNNELGLSNLLKAAFNDNLNQTNLLTAGTNNLTGDTNNELLLSNSFQEAFNQKANYTNLLTAGINSEFFTSNSLLQTQVTFADRLKTTFAGIETVIKRGIVDNLKDAIQGSISFGEAMSNVLNRIGDQLLESGLNTLVDSVSNKVQGKPQEKGGIGGALGTVAGSFLGPLGGIAGGFLGGLLPFANGGRPPVGQAALVGEKGPEIFVPSTAGTIIPNNQLGGGTTNNYVTVNVQDGGVTSSGNNVDLNALGAAIGATVQAQLIKEKRPGGLLTR